MVMTVRESIWNQELCRKSHFPKCPAYQKFPFGLRQCLENARRQKLLQTRPARQLS